MDNIQVNVFLWCRTALFNNDLTGIGCPVGKTKTACTKEPKRLLEFSRILR